MIVIPDIFREAEEPWFLRIDSSPANAYELAWKLQCNGIVSRVLRGTKMTTAEALFDEFGAAMQLPDYFGENWPALDECLTDLSWMPGDAYALIVTDAPRLLDSEGLDELQTLVSMLEKVV